MIRESKDERLWVGNAHGKAGCSLSYSPGNQPEFFPGLFRQTRWLKAAEKQSGEDTAGHLGG